MRSVPVLSGGVGRGPVEGVGPVGAQQKDQQHDGAERPGEGVGPGDGLEHREGLHRQGNVGHPDTAPEGQHGDHGHKGASAPPEHPAGAVGEGQHTKEGGHGAGVDGAEAYGLRLVHKGPQSGGGRRQEQQADELRHRHAG